MEAVLLYLALNGPSYARQIHQATGHRDAAVFKAMVRMNNWEWMARRPDPLQPLPTP
jgi:predicted transcriptional regulator